eukprot:g4611.t1
MASIKRNQLFQVRKTKSQKFFTRNELEIAVEKWNLLAHESDDLIFLCKRKNCRNLRFLNRFQSTFKTPHTKCKGVKHVKTITERSLLRRFQITAQNLEGIKVDIGNKKSYKLKMETKYNHIVDNSLIKLCASNDIDEGDNFDFGNDDSKNADDMFDFSFLDDDCYHSGVYATTYLQSNASNDVHADNEPFGSSNTTNNGKSLLVAPLFLLAAVGIYTKMDRNYKLTSIDTMYNNNGNNTMRYLRAVNVNITKSLYADSTLYTSTLIFGNPTIVCFATCFFVLCSTLILLYVYCWNVQELVLKEKKEVTVPQEVILQDEGPEDQSKNDPNDESAILRRLNELIVEKHLQVYKRIEKYGCNMYEKHDKLLEQNMQFLRKRITQLALKRHENLKFRSTDNDISRQWDHASSKLLLLNELPKKWTRRIDEKGRYIYYDLETGHYSFKRPGGVFKMGY